MKRSEQLAIINDREFDVTIVGGGISGSRLYETLCKRGFKVLLIDKGDFGCGTSQASGMMIWGGLLYLKNLDFKTVRKLCKARDRMIAGFPQMVDSCSFRYMPCVHGGRNRLFVYWVLLLYWLIGSGKRHLPRGEKVFDEKDLIQDEKFKKSLVYEEAFLKLSDCRFVLQWLTSWNSANTQAINYCSIKNSEFHNNQWHLELQDGLSEEQVICKSKFIVNAAGVWADQVNENFEIDSDFRHVFSKGVYLNLPRPEVHKTALIFEMGHQGDSQSYVPWGPVSMWGPTETSLTSLDGGFKAAREDIEFLLKMANRNLADQMSVDDIVSLRCGVRPLAVKKGFSKKVYPLDLSRKHLIYKDRHKNFLALYGGKLTSCGVMAEEVCKMLPGFKREIRADTGKVESESFNQFPGIADEMPSPQWCRKYEACYNLEDYLRRRTNIAQWIKNGGFGHNYENEAKLIEVAKVFYGSQAEMKVAEYKSTVQNGVLNKLKEE